MIVIVATESKAARRWIAFLSLLDFDVATGSPECPAWATGLIRGARQAALCVVPDLGSPSARDAAENCVNAVAGRAEWRGDLLVVGASRWWVRDGLADWGWYGRDGRVAGVLGQFDQSDPGWYFDHGAPWGHCSRCQGVCVFHTFAGWYCTPCNAYEAGDNFIDLPDFVAMQAAWEEAGFLARQEQASS